MNYWSSFSERERYTLVGLGVGLVVVVFVLIFAIATADSGDKEVTALPTLVQTMVIPTQVTPRASPTTKPTRTPKPTNTLVVAVEDYNQAAVDEIIAKVVALRELELTDEIGFSMLDEEQMAAEMRSLYSIEELRAEIDYQWLLYKTLGLVPEDIFVSDEDIERLANQFAGVYVPEKKHLYIVTGRVNMNVEDEVIFAHEYTHAIQDQHFDLGSYLINAKTTDANLAARALVEGDATMMMAIYAYGNTLEAQWDYLAYQASFAEEPILDLPDISERASWLVGFPYEQGVYFVLDLYLRGGWDSVNQAFFDPPRSSEQVLHPEKYSDHRDWPQEVSITGDPGEGWQLMLEDTLGEFALLLHVDEFLDDVERAALAADGWDGDQVARWHDSRDRPLVLWETVWDSSGEAAEFEEIYRQVIPARFEGAVTTDDIWWEAAGVVVGLLREGDRVWLVWGPDYTVTNSLLESSR